MLQISHKFRVLWHRRTELTEVPGRYKNAVPVPRVFVGTSVQSLQKFRVRVLVSYRTYTSSGYGYECPTELTEVLCRAIPGVFTPGMVLYVNPTEHNLAKIYF